MRSSLRDPPYIFESRCAFASGWLKERQAFPVGGFSGDHLLVGQDHASGEAKHGLLARVLVSKGEFDVIFSFGELRIRVLNQLGNL